VASFRTERKARAALAEMDAATGLGGRVVNSPGGADPWFRVVIGSFATREDARARSAELMGRGIVPEDCMVVAAPRRAGVEPPSAP
jgi:cell division protein FtsN